MWTGLNSNYYKSKIELEKTIQDEIRFPCENTFAKMQKIQKAKITKNATRTIAQFININSNNKAGELGNEPFVVEVLRAPKFTNSSVVPGEGPSMPFYLTWLEEKAKENLPVPNLEKTIHTDTQGFLPEDQNPIASPPNLLERILANESLLASIRKNSTEEMKQVIDSDNCELIDRFLEKQGLKNYCMETLIMNDFEKSLFESMLRHAVRNGKLNSVKHLIEFKKVSVDLVVKEDTCIYTGTIFHTAAANGHLTLIKYLHEVQGVGIDCRPMWEGWHDTALSRAALKGHLDVMRYLISKKANLNPEITNSTILDQAIQSQKVAAVMLLVESGTKVESKNLRSALESGNLEIVRYLVQKLPLKSCLFFSPTPILVAVGTGNVELVKFLLEEQEVDLFEEDPYAKDSLYLLLYTAAKSHQIEMMKYLLEEKGLGEKILANPSYIKGILKSAVEKSFFKNPKKSNKKRIQFLQYLMEEKHLLLTQEELKSISEENANFSSMRINSYLQSYLYESVETKNLLRTIALNGLNAVGFGDLLKLYNRATIKRGACSDFNYKIHHHIQKRKLSLDWLEDFFIKNKSIMTEALFYFSSLYDQNDISVLNLLFKLGVDLNAENENGIAAIHLALGSGGYSKIVQFYMDCNADLSKKNRQGITAAKLIEGANVGRR